MDRRGARRCRSVGAITSSVRARDTRRGDTRLLGQEPQRSRKARVTVATNPCEAGGRPLRAQSDCPVVQQPARHRSVSPLQRGADRRLTPTRFARATFVAKRLRPARSTMRCRASRWRVFTLPRKSERLHAARGTHVKCVFFDAAPV
jgi:hypothetical protein